MKTEKWKKVNGYEGIYEVSNLGRVKSLPRYVNSRYGLRLVSERILKPFVGQYPVVNLCKNSEPHKHYVHRLVVEAFLPNTENKPCVNHIDGVKENNSLSNLEWVTYSENAQHAMDNNLNRKGEEHHCAKLSWDKVRVIRDEYGTTKTATQLSKEYGVTFQAIKKVVNHISWNE